MNQLTKRERKIMDLVVAGFDKNEIAKHLGISTNTANMCVSNIYRKLDSKHNAFVKMN